MRLPARLQLIVAAGALGIACGAAAQRHLPAAGSDRDDGTGLLAAASSGLYSAPRYGAAGYGGARYSRPSRYGGGRYANYQLDVPSSGHRGFPSTYLSSYSVDDRLPTGRIRGTVSWTRAPTARATPGCPPPAAAPADAIVMLRGVRRGRGFPDARLRDQSRFQLGGLVAIDRCGFEPRTQAVGPIGLLGTAVQRGDDRARVLGVLAGSSEVLFDLELRSRGERRNFEMPKAGIIELASAGDTRGWIAVIGHPLHAAVDPDGRFVIDRVPAGTHSLSVWHPPVGGGAAIEVSRQVTVRANRTTAVSLGL